MKSIVLFSVVAIISTLSGGWLYILSAGAVEQYQQTFSSFGVVPPQITLLLFSAINYWWAIFIAVVLIGYFPMFISRSKWRYTSILTSSSCFIALVFVVYAPIVSMRSVI